MNECVMMIQDLEYADDMLLISDNMDKLEMMLQDMHESCSEMGLTISTKKSKLMAVLPSLAGSRQLTTITKTCKSNCCLILSQ